MEQGNDVGNGTQKDHQDQEDVVEKGQQEQDEPKHVDDRRGSRKESSTQIPVNRDSEYYKMTNKYRGDALIFCRSSDHDGDAEMLEKTLKNLGFEVEVKRELTMKKVYESLEQAAQKDRNHHDCILVILLGYEELNGHPESDFSYKPKRVWSNFNTEACPSLAGKPKIFFFISCRGHQIDSGHQFDSKKESDSESSSSGDDCVDSGDVSKKATGLNSRSAGYYIPTYADFLISHSTIQGFASWRDESKGSWFVQALCEVLHRDGSTSDILSIMTKVQRKVALYFGPNDPESKKNETEVMVKQIPCFTSMLIRNLVFTAREK